MNIWTVSPPTPTMIRPTSINWRNAHMTLSPPYFPTALSPPVRVYQSHTRRTNWTLVLPHIPNGQMTTRTQTEHWDSTKTHNRTPRMDRTHTDPRYQKPDAQIRSHRLIRNRSGLARTRKNRLEKSSDQLLKRKQNRTRSSMPSKDKIS